MKQKLKCVMLIDDDEPTNFLSSIFIEEVSCSEHIEVAQSAKQALTYLSGSQMPDDKSIPYPDLIFLDINMPAMDGWEFIEHYKKLKKEYNEKVIIIILSTSLNPDDILKATRTPEIAGFEHKPLTPEKIDGILKKYFENNF